jgi:hypothetical protein
VSDFTTLSKVRRNQKKRIKVLGEKNWGTEHSKGNKTVPAKVATTCTTEDEHKQTTKAALRYRPKGRRNLERSRKRWTDQIHLEH